MGNGRGNEPPFTGTDSRSIVHNETDERAGFQRQSRSGAKIPAKRTHAQRAFSLSIKKKE
jgi:hypothetical protein